MNLPELISLEMTEAEAVSELLPTLLGSVFHFTKEENWARIAECGFVDANTKGQFRSNSVHSHESLGRHLGAVCLFDLRGKDDSILAKDLILHDYFTRRWKKSPSCFLVLAPVHHASLITLDEVPEEIQQRTMYIPRVESWHPGNLPIEKLACVYRLEIRKVPRRT